MKQLITFALAAIFALPLCAQTPTNMTTNTLVAFFSATGTTKAAAQRLAAQHHARLWEIVPAEPYTAADLDWRNSQSRSSLEMNDPDERPMIKRCTDVTPYDTIYIGFPIWWGICPRIINSWIDNNLFQLENKTLIPFATSGSSGIEEAEAYLKRTYPTLNWQKGMLMNRR
jgi:menaquinone-dependent protoporphyrinogen IX oxidase